MTIITKSGREYTGFASVSELASMHWKAFDLDQMATTTWFTDDRTREGLIAIIEASIIEKARRQYAAIR